MSASPWSPGRFTEAETPVHDYFYSMVEISVVRIFVQYNIFDAIPDDGITISELSKKSGVAENLLHRLSNFLVAAKVLISPAPGYISPTSRAKFFREPRAKLFYPHIFDAFMTSGVRWPEYFQVNGPDEPQKSNRSPFGLGSGYPEKSFYEVLELMPERSQAFNETMALGLGDMPVTGLYDFKWVEDYAARSESPDRALLVDVGGGKGQALKAIIEENPGIPVSSCVLQDQAEAIQEAIAEGGLLEPAKKVASSIFGEQPTKGALLYYIRRVLNDWPDDECVILLSNIRAVCAPDSRVLVSENLLPDNPSITLAAGDLWMMNFAGKRRTEKMFSELASASGFRVSSISKDKSSNSAVIEMVPQ